MARWRTQPRQILSFQQQTSVVALSRRAVSRRVQQAAVDADAKLCELAVRGDDGRQCQRRHCYCDGRRFDDEHDRVCCRRIPVVSMDVRQSHATSAQLYQRGGHQRASVSNNNERWHNHDDSTVDINDERCHNIRSRQLFNCYCYWYNCYWYWYNCYWYIYFQRHKYI